MSQQNTSQDTKRVKVEVLKNHIKRGVCGDTRKCMVALAIQKVLKPTFAAVVFSENAHIYPCAAQGGELEALDYSTFFALRLPKKATAQIHRFDTRKSSAKPISFFVDVPTNLLR